MKSLLFQPDPRIRQAGHDVRISHVSRCIQEVMEAAEARRHSAQLEEHRPRAPTISSEGGWGGFGGPNHLLRIWLEP